MPFPLTVADVWKMFEWYGGKRTEQKKAVCEWLDSVYTDLEDLSAVWFKICATLETADENNEIEKALTIIWRGRDARSQWLFSGRLKGFYNSVSRVLWANRSIASRVLGPNRGTDFHRDFVDTLGSLLVERQRAREILDKEMASPSIRAEARREMLLRLREHAEAIQQEAVSLQVLIKTFKAEG